MPVKIKETAITQWCLKALAVRGIAAWRMNTGGMTNNYKRKDGSVGKNFIKFGRTGQADITGLLKDGRRLEVEVKALGGKQSDSQKEFQKMIEDNGGLYLLVHSPAELLAELEYLGIP